MSMRGVTRKRRPFDAGDFILGRQLTGLLVVPRSLRLLHCVRYGLHQPGTTGERYPASPDLQSGSPRGTPYAVPITQRAGRSRGENDGDGTSLFFTMPRTVGTHLPHWGTQPRWRNTPAGDEIPVSIATETCFSVKALQMQTYTVPSPGRFFLLNLW